MQKQGQWVNLEMILTIWIKKLEFLILRSFRDPVGYPPRASDHRPEDEKQSHTSIFTSQAPGWTDTYIDV